MISNYKYVYNCEIDFGKGSSKFFWHSLMNKFLKYFCFGTFITSWCYELWLCWKLKILTCMPFSLMLVLIIFTHINTITYHDYIDTLKCKKVQIHFSFYKMAGSTIFSYSAMRPWGLKILSLHWIKEFRFRSNFVIVSGTHTHIPQVKDLKNIPGVLFLKCIIYLV